MTIYALKPLFFDAWATCRVVVGDRQIAKFRTTTEAEAYMAKLEGTPRHVPGQQASSELRAMAEEAASALRLRGGQWKRKVIEEDDVVDAELNTELPF